jgi:hypothetical protein
MCHHHNLALTRAFGILRVLGFAFFSFQLKAVSSEVAFFATVIALLFMAFAVLAARKSTRRPGHP